MEERICVPEIFGSDVFNEETMQKRLRPEIYQAWKRCVDEDIALSLPVADEIAREMKIWAIQKGATHFTHWFQPMTGITAEKHEGFLKPVGKGKVIMAFSGKSLVCGEPDASSFPNGGLRAAFEARGYTAWDPTAFAFVRDGSLYIPTCFCSYTGAALDKKTPLLRSMKAVSKAAVRILRILGEDKVTKVIPCVGAEQEYFLLPKGLYAQREDLRLTGRTLFGAMPPKGQELEDHYYGTIRSRVASFMQDLDEQLWRLGILSKTKHNEAAPCQHELAPIYTDANSACDANQLTMQVMKKCAAKHDLVCLFHEKPFQGVNGSGKHNNWSLVTNTGENLLSPGEDPRQNAQFLVFLTAFIKGVDEYQGFLRAVVSGAGNDGRLGGYEAPPAIISIYLGTELEAIVHSLIHGTNYAEPEKSLLRIGVDVLPPIPRDTTDRNRTSPLAFTGNKFEFRMVGSSQSIAGANIVLNTVMAEALNSFADELENAPNLEHALQTLISQTLRKHARILFCGNSYSPQWWEEARARGLTELPSTAEALSMYLLPKNIALFCKHGIFTQEEFHARYEIHMEAYQKNILIEAKTALNMVRQQILPAALSYVNRLCDTVRNKQAIGITHLQEAELAEHLSERTDSLFENCEVLTGLLKAIPSELAKSVDYCHQQILPLLDRIREDADAIEEMTDKSVWPYPTYADMLFY